MTAPTQPLSMQLLAGGPLATFTRATRRHLLIPALVGLFLVLSFGWVSGAGDHASAGPPGTVADPAAAMSAAGWPADSAGSPAVLLPGAGVTGDRADAAMKAFDTAFYAVDDARGLFKATTSGQSWAPFWRTAELVETVEDAYQHSGRPVYKRMVTELRRGVAGRFGADWTGRRKYNDDVMWMVLAFVRGYEITGDRAFLAVARRNFDAAYARGWSGDFGGGLWWTTDRNEKNACVAGPASIAAWHLYRDLGDASYLAKAKGSFAWLRQSLFDAQTGAVYDHVSHADGGGDVVDRTTYTYNQGTFIGAADLLYRTTGDAGYADDARRALAFAQTHLCTPDGLLREEGIGRDGGGFKGIFARYAVGFVARAGPATYTPWLAGNALAAWSHRDARGLMGQDWSAPTPSGMLHAFDASSAVVLLQLLRQP